MDNRGQVRELLTSRRAKIIPQQAGLPDGGNHRVRGLCRGDVAVMAGISVEYYAKLERGAIAGRHALRPRPRGRLLRRRARLADARALDPLASWTSTPADTDPRIIR